MSLLPAALAAAAAAAGVGGRSGLSPSAALRCCQSHSRASSYRHASTNVCFQEPDEVIDQAFRMLCAAEVHALLGVLLGVCLGVLLAVLHSGLSGKRDLAA